MNKNFITHLIVLLALLQTIGYTKEEEKNLKDGWKELTNCKLMESSSNDGDSFHVEHKGKRYVFRLYLVDSPETDYSYISRNLEQIEEFGSPLEKLLITGKLASELTSKLLSKPFTVLTKGEDARGQSQLGRSYAFIKTRGGEDLGEILIEYGLARSHGREAQAPTIRNDRRQKYDRLAESAKRNKLGAWGSGEVKLPNNSLLTKANILRSQREIKELKRSKKQEWEELVKQHGDNKINISKARVSGLSQINEPKVEEETNLLPSVEMEVGLFAPNTIE